MSDLDVDLRRAIDQAGTARAAIAAIIDRVRSGDLELAAAFAAADQDQLTGRCFAVKVIEVIPGIGKVRARRTMADVGMAEDVWLADVSAVHREQLGAALAVPAET